MQISGTRSPESRSQQGCALPRGSGAGYSSPPPASGSPGFLSLACSCFSAIPALSAFGVSSVSPSAFYQDIRAGFGAHPNLIWYHLHLKYIHNDYFKIKSNSEVLRRAFGREGRTATPNTQFVGKISPRINATLRMFITEILEQKSQLWASVSHRPRPLAVRERRAGWAGKGTTVSTAKLENTKVCL